MKIEALMAGNGPTRPRARGAGDLNGWLYRSPMEWNGMEAARASTQKAAPKPSKPHYPSVNLDVKLSDGSTIRQNMKTVDDWMDHSKYPVGDPEASYPFALGMWLGSVLPSSRWGKRLGEPEVQHNYGATWQRFGLPLNWAQRAAGLAEQSEPITGYTGGSSPENRVGVNLFAPFGSWPYGDSPGGSRGIGGGFEAAKAQDKRRR